MTIKRLPSLLAAVVLAALVALSVVEWWVIRDGVDRQNQALLKEQTSQAVLLLQRRVEHTRSCSDRSASERRSSTRTRMRCAPAPASPLRW
jgi:hypothetical protein